MNPDAVVIGAGPNGLVAAIVLAAAGWRVVVLEANDEPGGAVRTAEVTAPGFRNDLFSAFYPMTAVSPVISELRLEEFGLEWTHAPKVLAHPRREDSAVVLSRDLDVTAASLDRSAVGDGERFRHLFERWRQIEGPLMGSLLRPFPPVRNAGRLLSSAGFDGMVDLGRMSLLPVRRMVEEEFHGESAALLFAGNALHADLTPDASGSALFGWMLVSLGQHHGFPVPVGGAGSITAALVLKARAHGVDLQCGQRVARIEVADDRVVGVTTTAGDHLACPVVLAGCDARALMLQLVGADRLPSSYLRRLQRFQRAASTIKVDWALSAPVPWSDPAVHGAGTVHIADSLDELTMTAAQLSMRQIPDKPFLLIGQMTTADPTRSPPGTESMWAYTHVPQQPVSDAGDGGVRGEWGRSDIDMFAERMERRIERHAPGFMSCILARHVMGPKELQGRDSNLVGGDISGGTAQLHQQLVFRPITGHARPETPIKNLYLASASAHPGGAVHGACGANAARAALLHNPRRRAIGTMRRMANAVTGRRSDGFA
jgi:phytoene dehydrogenase-like protein